MPVYCCDVCEHFLPPPESKIVWGWCQHPDADEAYDVESSGGFMPYRDRKGEGDLRVTPGMCCERFVLLNTRKKQERTGSD